MYNNPGEKVILLMTTALNGHGEPNGSLPPLLPPPSTHVDVPYDYDDRFKTAYYPTIIIIVLEPPIREMIPGAQ